MKFPEGELGYSYTFSLPRRYMGWVINSTPRSLYPLYKKLGGPQGGLDGWEISRLPPGLDPWTVQPLASCYTNEDIPAHKLGG